MERELKRNFRARINAATTADVAKDIDIDLFMARHDYFGKMICEAYNIEFRTDVPLTEILLDTIDGFDPMAFKIPNITPDNYVALDGRIFLIDYKVTLSMETVYATMDKYTNAVGEVQPNIPAILEVVIVQINPRTKEIYISNDIFREIFGVPQIDINFDDFFELKDMLYTKFENDDEFLLKIAHGDFTLTAPWINEDTPELYEHDMYKEFIDSLPEVYRDLFIESLDFNAYNSERWNSLLYRVRDLTRAEYNLKVSQSAKKVFETNGKYNKPSKDEIKEGWDLMSERIKTTRTLLSSSGDQKPSIHFLWCEPSGNSQKRPEEKIANLSKQLQGITGCHDMVNPFRELGACFDISEGLDIYIIETRKRKDDARRKQGQVQNKKLSPFLAGKASVIWEQQFVLSQENITLQSKKKILKDFCGIGNHKVFKAKTQDDIDLTQPKILDFNNESIYLDSVKMINKTKNLLSKEAKYKAKSNFILDNFGRQIFDSSAETFNVMEKIFSSQYWSFINDYSTLMRNMLAMSQYNRPNTFRIATCANDNLYGILLPSSDIKTKQSTIVYIIVCLHDKEEDIIDPGAKCYTFKSANRFITISRAMRLDKQRCQRIVSSPGLFLLSTLLMYNNNPMVNLADVMNFTLFTSLSVTKAMLSLTEPSRYMIMNSLAISSDVKGYISEKFSPYTKTLFSVFMTHLIKNACFQAYNQRDKVSFRDIYLTDFEITQKGVRENRDIKSIWFPGNVTIKEYLNQIYMPFYFNSKGLHEKHHVMIDLIKTVGEIEIGQQSLGSEYWSDIPKPQTVCLPIYLNCLSRSLITDTSRHNHLRNKVESRNNFKRSPATVSTFTSSKSSVKTGDFSDFKERKSQKESNMREIAKIKLANPIFFDDETIDSELKHANYQALKQCIPDFKDYITTKNFDRLYEMYADGTINDETTIQCCLNMMRTHKEHNFAIFNKGQKTAKDREIFEPEWETKAGMYVIERLAKERCKLNLDEMISEPGDGKLKVLEQKCEAELRYMLSKQTELRKKTEMDNYRSTKIEINADMTKWSAQDVFVKYFWLIALDPILYPFEKKRIIYFMCNYLNKNLIIPDEVMCSLIDQKLMRENDIFLELTNNYTRNYFPVKRNWLQGNYNYTSSYVHSCAMLYFKDIMKETGKLLQGDCLVNTLVHSDDNQTSVTFVQNIMPDENLIEHIVKTFTVTCLTFGCQANMKKTYFTNFIKEFVSLFNIMGEPFSIYGRFLLTSVGDCAYIGPYEDLSSRLSSIQSSIKHGCPPSYCWAGIAVAHWMTYLTYNMLPGQINDPIQHTPYTDRKKMPIELFGVLDAPLHVIALAGMECQNLSFLINLLQKNSTILQKKDPVISQIQNIKNWRLSDLTEEETLNLKILRHIHLDSDQTSDNIGETSDMRSRSLLTPRKFTTAGVMRKLTSFIDYQTVMSSKDKTKELLEYISGHPELTITKGENKEEYMNIILYRYNSKRFKESLSIQNPSQLFIEQILFSHKPVIDYDHLSERFLTLSDSIAVENHPKISGRYTFVESYYKLIQDLNSLPLTIDDIIIVFNHCIANDPLLVTIANSMVLSTIGSPLPKVGIAANSMPEFRSMKLIHHSPALVLRAYSRGNPDIHGANVEEMERDLVHLNQFIDEVGLIKKMEDKLSKIEFADEIQYNLAKIRELTKVYQICYEYIKSADHKVKVFILPTKTKTVHDFCSVIQGSLIKDDKWFSMHYLKQVVVQGHKSIITKTESTDYNIAVECFRLLFFFLDSFVSQDYRTSVLKEMISTYSYKNIPLEKLLDMICQSQNRFDFIPLLWRTGYLTQNDLDRYDAMKSSERITWNMAQTSREFDRGPIDLQINGYNRSIRIVGQDDILTAAELRLINTRYETIINAGRKLLNTRHGMRFERMQKCTIDEGEFYITYQRKNQNQYTYQIHNYSSIITRNEENKNKGRFFNEIIPVCLVIVTEQKASSKVLLRRVPFLNDENFLLSKVQITPTEQVAMRRANLSKCSMFYGPDLNIGMVSLRKLLNCQELMTLDYSKISNLSLISISKILSCDGTQRTDCDEFDFNAFSDDIMEVQEMEDIETTPILKLYTSRYGNSRTTYKNAINESLIKSMNNFKTAFDLASDGYYSRKNLGILSIIVSTAKLLETNEWSSILVDCIHITLIANNMDSTFHKFEMPLAFLENPLSFEVKWLKLKSFIQSLPDVIDPMWSEIFHHFKEKSITLLDKRIAEPIDFMAILDEIEVEEGLVEFEFH
ncbi:RNA-dependent RNA polymerase [Lukuni virus]|uniref:RNA-directed RNA polymerase L n=1 Tax=Lukuni virus TaxID=1678227 RepID=A0A0R7FK50_9VIRU|nr:RNA-dependent RNA polymerase [Lukuni virus]AKO90162.1 RNA-dependent RNA polymerase [Lukuni virus]